MRRLVPSLALLLLAACGKNMVQQARYDSYEAAPIFENGMAMQAPPEGTVPRDAAARQAETERPPMSLALIERGQERYGIFCAPCHGADGSGNGIVPSRGFPHPPDMRSARLVEAPASHFYAVMTNGYGAMFSYGDRVPPRDRWAIAAYIRALQRVDAPAAREGTADAD